jgi:hypothetical protein
MPSGDAQRQWFTEMIEMLRQQWHPGLSLAGLAARSAPGHHASANKKRPQYYSSNVYMSKMR